MNWTACKPRCLRAAMAALCLTALILLSFAAAPASAESVAEGAKGRGLIPRLVDFVLRDVAEGAHPLPNDVPADFTAGADLVVWEDTLAFCNYNGMGQAVDVWVQDEEGRMQPQAEYKEEMWISNIVLDGYGLAYLVGGPEYEEDMELVTVDALGVQRRVSLGAMRREREPYMGPLLRLSDGRLLVADGAGLLRLCDADGMSMRQLSDIPLQDFVYFNQCIYFTNLQGMVTYEHVYRRASDSYEDVSYPRLYRMRLDGTHVERVTDAGVRGLAAWGPYILYQNMDDPYVWPVDDSLDEWLCGVVYCINGITSQRRTLAIDSARYLATPYGMAAWLPDFSAGGGTQRTARNSH